MELDFGRPRHALADSEAAPHDDPAQRNLIRGLARRSVFGPRAELRQNSTTGRNQRFATSSTGC